MSLCFRCQHRVDFLEKKYRPRSECGDIELSKYACYMFKPIIPIITEPLDKSDKRPRFAGILSKREKFSKVANEEELKLKAKIDNDEVMLYWVPKE